MWKITSKRHAYNNINTKNKDPILGEYDFSKSTVNLLTVWLTVQFLNEIVKGLYITLQQNKMNLTALPKSIIFFPDLRKALRTVLKYSLKIMQSFGVFLIDNGTLIAEHYIYGKYLNFYCVFKFFFFHFS